jgi:hypothetical protein
MFILKIGSPPTERSLSDYTGRLKLFIGCFGRINGWFGIFLMGGGAF